VRKAANHAAHLIEAVQHSKHECRVSPLIQKKHGVSHLFGSAVLDRGTGPIGDLNFLVDLGDLSPGEYAETYFSPGEALEELFSRPVDLIEGIRIVLASRRQ
jgi:predicted nucleotidyltransferase